MDSQQYRFYEIFAPKELDRALAEPALKAKKDRDAESTATEQYWKEVKATDQSLKEITRFVTRYPQFVASRMENRTTLIDFLKERNLPVTQTNLEEAFQELGRQGALTLDFSKVGIIRVRYANGQTIPIRKEDLEVHKRRDKNLSEILEDSTEVTGHALSRHPLLHILLSPHNAATQERREQAAISATEYRQQHPEAFRQPKPASVEQRERQAVLSFISFHPEYALTDENAKALRDYLMQQELGFTLNNIEAAYAALVESGKIQTTDAVASSGITKVVDYNENPRGAHALPEMKESLAFKINKMSAQEYAEWVRVPSNRKAIDNQFASGV